VPGKVDKQVVVIGHAQSGCESDTDEEYWRHVRLTV